MFNRWLNHASLTHLLPFISPYRWWLLLVGMMLLAIAFLTALPPWLIQYAIDVALPAGNSQWLLLLGVSVLMLSLVEGLMSFFQQVLSEWISQKVIHDIRNQLFHHLNQLSFSFFDRTRVGDLIARIVSDTDTLKRFIGFGLLKVITNFMVLGWIFISLTWWNPWLGVTFMIMLPFMAHAMWAYSRQVRPAFQRIRRTTGELTSFVREQLAGVFIIKLFGNESMTKNHFRRENEHILVNTLTATRIGAFWLPYSEVLLGFFTGLVLLAGGWLITSGTITIGTLVGFLAYMNLLNRPIRQTGFMLSLFQQADAASQRIVELLQQQAFISDDPEALTFIKLSDSLEMRSVSFAYETTQVLKDISFQVHPGEILAIVGPSGAGKTTLIHLLLRFYEPSSGQVLMDNKPIQHYSITSLREKIGLVMQHPFLFEGTLKENIAMGSSHAPMEAIKQSAKQAQLHTFIESLPLKYDTPIGERGVRLSGGQAQRLALARVLLRKPEILVLDEPTASVDHLTDASIMDSLAHLMENKTTLVIAHRLATLHNAHRILFIEHGRVTGLGSHNHLMSSHVGYREFVEASGYAQDEEVE